MRRMLALTYACIDDGCGTGRLHGGGQKRRGGSGGRGPRADIAHVKRKQGR